MASNTLHKKVILTVSTFALACVSSLGQSTPQIIVKVKDGAARPISYYTPVAGRYFIGFPVKDSLDEQGQLALPVKEKTPGVYGINYQRAYRLYVQPGKQYVVNIDAGNKETPLAIEGPDKEGSEALSKLQFEFYETRGRRYYKEDMVFARLHTRVLRELDSCMQPFQQLYAQKTIDQALYTYANNLVRNYYATVLASTLMEPVRQTTFHKDSTHYDAARISYLDSCWQAVLAISDVFDPAAAIADTYPDYCRFMLTWYFNYYLPQKQGTYKRFEDESAAEQMKYEVLVRHYTQEPMREYQLATFLRELTLEDHYQSVIPDLYKDFTRRYRRSVYNPLLALGVAKVQDFLDKRKNTFTAAQQFVDQYEAIGSVKELAARFQGKTVFVDLWATWCGPCKKEFAYNKELKAFLKKHNMEMLYVSIDKTAADEQWKAMIKYYNLEGWHVRVSERLRRDLFGIFGNNGALSIPRYAIFKDGKMVLDAAKAPSTKKELYRQLEQYKM